MRSGFALVFVSAAVVTGGLLHAAGNEPPAWAYAIPAAAVNGAGAAAPPPDTSMKQLPGSTLSFTRQQIADAIRASILSGDLAAGHRLPSEVDLADEYGVSRGTVRETMKRW